LIAIGLDQVKPPSVDMEKAMLPNWLLPIAALKLKRPSSHTAYRFPLAGSAATSGKEMPLRTPSPLKGSKVPKGISWAATIGWLQVVPWSVDRRMSSEIVKLGLDVNSTNESIKVPLGRTTI